MKEIYKKVSMRNLKLEISYDGTNYLGWQKTKAGPTIEESLEKAIFQILQHEVTLQAASRTDAGVHASGQIVNFFTSKDILLNTFKHSLNCILPVDIAVNIIEEVSLNFHPTLDCTGKEYHYHVCINQLQLPTQLQYAWHYYYPQDIDKIRHGISMLIGEHDFSAFCNIRRDREYAHYIRQIQSIEVFETSNKCLRFEIKGNNFLYKMVRNLVGTLVYVGCGKIGVDELLKILSAQDRTKAGITAPAKGLFLKRVFY